MGWPFSKRPDQSPAAPADRKYVGLRIRLHAKPELDPTDPAGKRKLFDGMSFVDDVLYANIPVSVVDRGIAGGYIRETGGEVVEHMPGGPPGNPWAVTHTFVKRPEIVFVTRDGDVTYRVIEQPGRYDDGLRWSYLAEKVTA